MSYDYQKKFFCPRLLDYVMIVGSRHPNRNNSVAQTPELLRRYPLEDHKDFPLPPDVVFFCQPEGCISVGPKRLSLRECTSFVFTLTEKDSGRTRYGICINFYRPFDKRSTSSGAGGGGGDRSKAERHASAASTSSGEQQAGGGQGRATSSSLQAPAAQDAGARPRSPRTSRKQKTASRVRNNTLTSLCIISHHAFFSTFRECLYILRKLIDACSDRSGSHRIGGSKANARDSVWSMLTGQVIDGCPNLVMHEVREIETWILRLLSAPVPVPGKTRVEVTILPPEIHHPLVFAMPDHTRFSLVDFPLHLPLELLGVDTCLKVLTCIMLEHKIILQSRDYNALSMSVMAFVAMLYPLEYMFPVIPLLPTCMSSAEQLLLVPTPFIIGVPTSFLMYKKGFRLPDDVWLADLDSNKIHLPSCMEEVPELPEPEGTVLKNHLKQALASMSMSPQPIKNLETVVAQDQNAWQRQQENNAPSANGFNPLIYGNDVDSVDVATRVAMVRFYNSPNILGNFAEHTRTLRLYPRPVVAFQLNSFMKSRPVKTSFVSKLARTQAVEYFVEWTLSPTNAVFLRVQTGMYDPLLIGDKAKWFSASLQKIEFPVYDGNGSTLGAAIERSRQDNKVNDDNVPTDESGSDSDGAESTSSSYSSLSDFVIDIQNSEINGDTPELYFEEQVLSVDESKVFQPPSQLQVPDDVPVSNSDSAMSAPDSEDNSSNNSSPGPRYADEYNEERSAAETPETLLTRKTTEPEHFRYDPASVASLKPATVATPTTKDDSLRAGFDSSGVTPTTTTTTMKTEANLVKTDLERLTPTKREHRLSDNDELSKNSPNSPRSLRSLDVAGAGGAESNRSTSASAGASPLSVRKEKEAFQSRTSSGGSLSGKTPPQRPPPPSPAALSRAISVDKSHLSPIVLEKSSQLQSKDATSVSPLALVHGVQAPQFASAPPSAFRLSENPSTKTIPEEEGRGGASAASRAGTTGQTTSSVATTTTTVGGREDEKGSIIDSLTDELNGYAQTASNTFSELFGIKVKQTVEDMATVGDSLSETGSSKSTAASVKSVKPFAPLGNRKALVEKSGLVKHATNQKKAKEVLRQSSISDQRTNIHSENQQFLKDVTTAVLEGRGIGWLKLGRVKKLMEDENYRNFVVSRLNTTLEKKLSDENQHLEDVSVPRLVFKGMLTMVKSLISGLENTYQNHGAGGMASAMMVLEIIHTHYWEKEGSSKSETSNQSLASSPFGSSEVLSTLTVESKIESRSLGEEHIVAALGSSVIVNGDEFENVDSKPAETLSPENVGPTDDEINLNVSDDVKRDFDNNISEDNRNLTKPGGALSAIPPGSYIGDIERQRDSSGYASESGDMLRELVKNKELLEMSKHKSITKIGSIDSDISDSSIMTSAARRKRSTSSFLSTKSHLSGGYRYREGRLLNLTYPAQDIYRNYLFESVIGKERSALWDQVQFWEDVFLDAVAQERDIIGMDQGPTEMMERYKSLGETEKKRLEFDEDRLLGIMLYNMVAFMVMMNVNKNEVRRKIRRLLGKCHIGLACSQEINLLLDQIESLNGNDVDLKPLGSRLMQKQSFTVHWGSDNTGDMLFMEVCDDCLILRSVNGSICDRWWYEKLVNMTYCPKTKALCLWRKHNGKTQLNKFYTKKCKELYFCVKESMEKASTRNTGKVPGLELGSEFPIQDLKSGQGGLLQVCMEGIGLLFANSKFFIELCRIKKCFTQKGGIFVLEEFDPKNRKIVQRKYRSSMAEMIVLAFHRVISVQLAIQQVNSPPLLTSSDGPVDSSSSSFISSALILDSLPSTHKSSLSNLDSSSSKFHSSSSKLDSSSSTLNSSSSKLDSSSSTLNSSSSNLDSSSSTLNPSSSKLDSSSSTLNPPSSKLDSSSSTVNSSSSKLDLSSSKFDSSSFKLGSSSSTLNLSSSKIRSSSSTLNSSSLRGISKSHSSSSLLILSVPVIEQ